MVSSSVSKRNAQEGTKTHGMLLHSRDIAVCILGLKHTSSVLGMARLQHGFGSLYQSKLGQHGMVRLGIMLARFGHVYTATANRAEPCWHGFKWQCKCSIR